MLDLGKLQDGLRELEQVEASLNEKLSNRGFRNELLQNPVEVLKREGISLPADREKAVAAFFQNIKVPEDANLRVASDLVSRAGGRGIFISIGIRF